MTENQNPKRYDLEDRTFQFAKNCRNFIKKWPRIITNIEYGKQLSRSSGSQAANYIEANESLSKKDFVMRVKICRKESKESRLWLNLCDINSDKELEKEQNILIKESTELMNIFGAIIRKAE